MPKIVIRVCCCPNSGVHLGFHHQFAFKSLLFTFLQSSLLFHRTTYKNASAGPMSAWVVAGL